MKVTAFDTSDYEVGVNGAGFKSDTTYLFGARSFSVWNADDLSLVYDSGARIEKNAARVLPDYFNWSNDDYVFEKRSAKKGPEPENVEVGLVDGKPYVFIGLERVSGNMMYDISDIHAPVYYDYLNTRDFKNSIDQAGAKPSYRIAGDVSPEGQNFVAADESPTHYPLLLVANEVSGTVSVIEIPQGYYTPETPATPTPTPETPATPTPGPESTPRPPVVTAKPSASPQPTVSPQEETVTGTKAVVQLSIDAQTNEGSGKLTDEAAQKLLDNAKADEAAGKQTTVDISWEAGSEAGKITLELSSDFVRRLSAETEADLRISTGLASITFGSKALEAIGKAAGGQTLSISIDAGSSGALSGSAQSFVGNRPVYDFQITDGTSPITSFAGESVKVQLPYTAGAGENINAILAYYINNSGSAVPVISKYNETAHSVDFITSHFSTFAVGYHYVGFSDTLAHWGKNSIDYTAARGVFTGLGDSKFGPDQKVTRGMLAAILGKMFAADLSATASFTDVAPAKYYSPYVAWAAANAIVQGTGNNRFAPDQAVTREELAVVLNNVLKYAGRQPSAAGPAAAFADSGQASAWASEAIANIQSLGWVQGKPGNLFDPQGTATRAEVSAVLAKYLESALTE